MNLADVFIYLFSILGFIIVFIAYWLLAAGLFPQFVERSAVRFGQSPIVATLLGAVTGLPLVIGGLALSGKVPNGGAKILCLTAAFLPMLLALFGSAGLALRVGQGLPSARDANEPWRRTLRGGVVLALSFALPFVGQLAMMPFAFLGGFGVFLMNLFQRAPATVPVPGPPPVPAMAPPLVFAAAAPFET